MVELSRRIFQAGFDIIGDQIGIIDEDFLLRNPGSKQVQHILNSDPHPPNTRAAPALIRVEGNPL